MTLDEWTKKLRNLVREAEKDGMRFWIENGSYEFLVTDSSEAQSDQDYDASRVIW